MKRLSVHTIFAETPFVYDKSFWEDFNVIPPEKELSEAIEKISSKIEKEDRKLKQLPTLFISSSSLPFRQYTLRSESEPIPRKQAIVMVSSITMAEVNKVIRGNYIKYNWWHKPLPNCFTAVFHII